MNTVRRPLPLWKHQGYNPRFYFGATYDAHYLGDSCRWYGRLPPPADAPQLGYRIMKWSAILVLGLIVAIAWWIGGVHA